MSRRTSWPALRWSAITIVRCRGSGGQRLCACHPAGGQRNQCRGTGAVSGQGVGKMPWIGRCLGFPDRCRPNARRSAGPSHRAEDAVCGAAKTNAVLGTGWPNHIFSGPRAVRPAEATDDRRVGTASGRVVAARAAPDLGRGRAVRSTHRTTGPAAGLFLFRHQFEGGGERCGGRVGTSHRRRGTFEDRLGEFNATVHPRLSSPRFAENEALLLLSLLAFNLSSMLRNKLEASVGGCWDLGRFQQTVLRAAGRVVCAGRRLRLDVEAAFAPLWEEVLACLQRWRLPRRWPAPRAPSRNPGCRRRLMHIFA